MSEGEVSEGDVKKTVIVERIAEDLSRRLGSGLEKGLKRGTPSDPLKNAEKKCRKGEVSIWG